MTVNGIKQPLALTSGEPGGVGPNLTAKLWRNRAVHDLPTFVYVGSKDSLLAHDPDLPIAVISEPKEAFEHFYTAIPVIDIPLKGCVTPGALNPTNAPNVIKAIRTATALTREGKTSAVVTNPIHKATLYSAGFRHAGHTDFLAHLCGEEDNQSVMMLMAADLKVVPVTIHIPLKDVAQSLTADAIIHAGVITAADLRDRFGITAPRLALTGLNPHAGEDGTIGLEEGTHIIPALQALSDMGITVTGPHSADTLFHAEARQNYDAVLAMYHDQALIPVKTIDFYGGVNVTLGLPIIRTSPDHGTAVDSLTAGTARPDSLLAALRAAQDMVDRSNE